MSPDTASHGGSEGRPCLRTMVPGLGHGAQLGPSSGWETLPEAVVPGRGAARRKAGRRSPVAVTCYKPRLAPLLSEAWPCTRGVRGSSA